MGKKWYDINYDTLEVFFGFGFLQNTMCNKNLCVCVCGQYECEKRQ